MFKLGLACVCIRGEGHVPLEFPGPWILVGRLEVVVSPLSLRVVEHGQRQSKALKKSRDWRAM